MDANEGKKPEGLRQRYDFLLILVASSVIIGLVALISLYPEQSRAAARWILREYTGLLGAPVLLLSLAVLVFLVWVCCSRYGAVKLGEGEPDYSTASWIIMMVVCSQGAGTLYWVFSEWGYHFNAAPQLDGAPVSEAMLYSQAIAFTFFHWGPTGWALMCAFVLPFAYHYYFRRDTDLRLSRLCAYALGDRLANSIPGRAVDLLFVFMIVANLCMTASLGAATLSATLAELWGITPTFTLGALLLIGVTAFFALFSLRGDQSGLQKITGMNSYFCIGLIFFIFLVGPTQFILDSIVDATGLLLDNYLRFSTRTDPVAASGHAQSWTVFYMALWLIYGPFMGLFVTRISRGRTLRQLIPAMILSGSLGMIVLLGIAGAYQQHLRVEGVLDVPAMLASGESMLIATGTFKSLPLPTLVLSAYALIVVLFLASSLEANSLTLATATSRNLRYGENPRTGFKLFWRFMLIGLPLVMGYIGTDIDTIKSISAVVGLTLSVVLCILYVGLFKALKQEPDILFTYTKEAQAGPEAAGSKMESEAPPRSRE